MKFWYGSVAAIAALSFAYNRYDTGGEAGQDASPPQATGSAPIYRNPDILSRCRQLDGHVDQDCAFMQAMTEIEAKDVVMAGIWAYHVTNEDKRRRLDHLALTEARKAAEAGVSVIVCYG